MSEIWDAVVLGAGAAGMFCAGVAARRGLRVLIIDHAPEPGEKIRISGGGRCNFTNRDGDRLERFVGVDPGFARHALRAYPPAAFIALVRAHRIGFHEKHRGQLFCDDSARRIVTMLRAEADAGAVRWLTGCAVEAVATADGADARGPVGDVGGARAGAARFVVHTAAGPFLARSLVVATGGLSIPKIGATDLGYRIARQFGHRIVETRPALVPLVFDAGPWAAWAGLAGVAHPVRIACAGDRKAPAFDEDLLFTHRGLSGPAVLQISTYWRPGQALSIDLDAAAHPADGTDREELGAWLRRAREGARQQLGTLLAERLPRRLVAHWLDTLATAHPRLGAQVRVAELGNRDLQALVTALRAWTVVPSGSEGYRKAEVTAGGVATAELDARSLMSRRQPGLHFIGEVVDITGWLGGYNFQWAWSSGHAAAMAIAEAGR